ncbi:PTPLA-domain-containing protein [Aaosphaeria arxii CBS 175.79]|uniref:Very-long-chain (3R)-3-hydroxyacyl-CoA dehydratase n=1 Tax=Aaosphaeria arxii CBS 175.79 TaxID=1450172 RepID=A0A6A5XE29_9PLEO|nr:PTPLA-domain-containing protein [Aaosphaeria arxii CBS 175.79]KAF2011415.1 PTPLA-domain-containing protein [Aaosphaeria arxii CBS 175.79]
MSTKSQTKPKAAASSLNNAYLLAYNAVSAGLWLGILGKVTTLSLEHGVGSGKVYSELEEFARLVQTGATLEVVHSLFGLVRAPLLTTLMQVASRLLLVWGIGYNFPQTTQYSPAYSSMLIAWSVTEVIRYSYFVFNLSGLGVPRLWTWLRYNTFLILYPLGVGSETWLVYHAIPEAEKLDEKYGWALYAILATYVPGFYMLFTHMLSQRKRILRAKKE